MKEITSLQHPLVKHFVKLMHNRDYRHEHQSVILEGQTLIREICSQIKANAILASDPHLIPSKIKSQDILSVTPAIIKKIAATEEPEGVFAEVAMPQPQSLNGLKNILVLDGINDPGNIGTLLRTALALGWDGVYFLPHCADPFNDKAMRASRGALFRMPYDQGTWEQFQASAKKNKWKILGADIEGTPVKEFTKKGPLSLVLGSESHGLSEAVKEHCERITIPMPGKMESLNVAVAGGILMYALGAGI